MDEQQDVAGTAPGEAAADAAADAVAAEVALEGEPTDGAAATTAPVEPAPVSPQDAPPTAPAAPPEAETTPPVPVESLPTTTADAAVWSIGAADAASTGWGALWRESAQGWVEEPPGRAVWRPIVTTAPVLSEWEVDTYLGLVAGDATLPSATVAVGLAGARHDASSRMVEEALARGAHAVIGVAVSVGEVAGQVLVTATGTAVTLKTSE